MDINDPSNANNPVLMLNISVILESGIGKMDTGKMDLKLGQFKFCKLRLCCKTVNSVFGIPCLFFFF